MMRPLPGSACAAQHRGDLDRMVGVIVVDGDALPFAGAGEAPFDAGEGGERRTDHLVADAGLGGDGERGKCVERVVMAERRQRSDR